MGLELASIPAILVISVVVLAPVIPVDDLIIAHISELLPDPIT